MFTTIEEAQAFLAECRAAMQALVDTASADETRSDFTSDEQAQWDQLTGWVDDTRRGIERLERIAGIDAGTVPGRVIEPVNIQRDNGDPFDLSSLPFNAGGSELRGRAVTAVESIRGISDADREKAVDLLERADTASGALARHMIATGNPHYESAFSKLLSERGYDLTTEERRAVDAVRSLSLTAGEGGYAVPFTIDPTIINTGSQYTNPFRQIARVVPIVSDKWHGIASDGVTASWAAEKAEATDDAPTLDRPEVPVHKAQCFVPFTIEVGQDWPSMQADLREMLAFEKDNLEGEAFAVGDGNDKPTGIVTALDGTTSEIAPGTPETFAVGDVYKVESALQPRFRANASWLANKGTYNAIRQFDTQGGANMWERIGAAQPPELLGYRAYEASAMKSSVDLNPAVTADNFLMVLGDFRNYLIADRIGLSVELIPHLFDTANNRPNGMRGFYAHWRVGGDSVNDTAFAMLSIPTTA